MEVPDILKPCKCSVRQLHGPLLLKYGKEFTVVEGAEYPGTVYRFLARLVFWHEDGLLFRSLINILGP